jgi:hypothetical protein
MKHPIMVQRQAYEEVAGDPDTTAKPLACAGRNMTAEVDRRTHRSMGEWEPASMKPAGLYGNPKGQAWTLSSVDRNRVAHLLPFIRSPLPSMGGFPDPARKHVYHCQAVPSERMMPEGQQFGTDGVCLAEQFVTDPQMGVCQTPQRVRKLTFDKLPGPAICEAVSLACHEVFHPAHIEARNFSEIHDEKG